MRKGQVSVEFMMVTAIALIILMGSTYFIFDYTRQSGDKSAIQQAAVIGYNIIDQAKNVYVQEGFITITVSHPDQIHQVYVVEEDTLVFELITKQGVFRIPMFSDIPINGTRLDGNRVHVENASQTIHSGRTRYRIENMGGWVRIRMLA